MGLLHFTATGHYHKQTVGALSALAVLTAEHPGQQVAASQPEMLAASHSHCSFPSETRRILLEHGLRNTKHVTLMHAVL